MDSEIQTMLVGIGFDITFDEQWNVQTHIPPVSLPALQAHQTSLMFVRWHLLDLEVHKQRRVRNRYCCHKFTTTATSILAASVM
jgi:hypothetical protein